MIGIEVKLNNIESVKKALKTMDEQLINKVIDVGAASIMDISTTAKKPGYVPYKTGTLKRSITGLVDIKKKGSDIEIGKVGSNLVYARIQEFGGRAGRGLKSLIKGKFYLTRAIADNQDKVRRRLQAINLIRK